MDVVLSAIILILIIIVLLLACLFVFCTKPNTFRFFDMPAAYCHRGYHNGDSIPENSIPAFKKSAELGLGVELDVRYTADKKVVVFHDADLKRICGEDKKVSELTFDELSQYRLSSTDEHIPLFEDVLKVCGDIPICCEIKSEDYAPNEDFLKDVYAMISSYPGQIVVESFNPYVLSWFRNNHPEIIRGQLSFGYKGQKNKTFEMFLLCNLLVNVISRPDFISYKFDEASIGLAMNRIYGTRLVAWTIRSMDEVDFAAQNGYSTFISENFDITEI